MAIAGFQSIFADYVVWDNDGLYALVTVVSIAFTVALIVVVMRKSREHDAVSRSKATSSLARSRAAQTSATSLEQTMIATQAVPPTATEQHSPPSTATPTAPSHGH